MSVERADIIASLERYLDFWRAMKVEDVPTIKALVTEDFHFVDPFNDVRSAEDMVRLLDHIFELCETPLFDMLSYGVSEQGPDADGNWQGYALWHFSFIAKRGGNKVTLDGMSALTFAPDGRLSAHIDHWDTGQQVLRHIPILGGLVKAVFNKMAADKRFRRP